MEDDLPVEVRRLIDDVLETMDHVEILFRIGRTGEATAEWLAQDAHVEPAQVTRVVRDLERAKLIVSKDGTYRVTSNPDARAAVDAFTETYNARPVTLIRAIYSRPSPLRYFADSFRIRREE
ncbi:MAG TPA: helix-turn-helix domain-containing protein [Gemmatimonadaceae bacterium]|jgi:hypothetical protein